MKETVDPAELVFVYGTLRPGASNAFRMEGAEHVGAATVEGRLHLISWYPGLVLGEGMGRVKGDLFRVRPEHMQRLDEFEGLAAGELAGAEYRRVRWIVRREEMPDEPALEAWIYEWCGPLEAMPIVNGGDWLSVESK